MVLRIGVPGLQGVLSPMADTPQKAAGRAHYWRNRDRICAYTRQWRADNPGWEKKYANIHEDNVRGPYSDEEIKTILDNPDLTSRALALILHRTTASVGTKRRALRQEERKK